MEDSLRLIESEGEQPPLPGIPAASLPVQPPLMAEVTDEGGEPIPGQLRLGANQASLDDIEPEPVQLSMLDDPPPWETPEPRRRPATPEGRLGRRRTRRGITPGQTSLF